MERGPDYTRDEIVFCAYIARFGRDQFDEFDIRNWGSCIHERGARSLKSIKAKVQNIAAMLQEEGHAHHRSIAPLSGAPPGKAGRRTNWDVVSTLVALCEKQHRAMCISVFKT